MKVAIVYNRDSRNVINLFGTPNREKIGLKTIKRLENALRKARHQVVALEADKDLITRLESFMPRVVSGEQPGMVFNVSYGIQGQARYTHVPSILEMVGIPYVASGPLAHSLALDKVVTKMILREHGLPTPDFTVLDSTEAPLPELRFPVVVKPKNEAVSFGLTVAHDEEAVREAAARILDHFRQPVLIEAYVQGREINVGLLGNGPPLAFPPVQLEFGSDGPDIYTYEDKTGRSGRTIGHTCPAPLSEDKLEEAKALAIAAFQAIGCHDCARVDMRLDSEERLQILEINSLPSLGEHGSYLVGAAAVGLDFEGFVARLVEVASARYFGTPSPPSLEEPSSDPGREAFAYLTGRRDELERRVSAWVNVNSRSTDPLGAHEAARLLGDRMKEVGLREVSAHTDDRTHWTWESRVGLRDGVLLVAHLDVPSEDSLPHTAFRREPEWLHGEGVGVSRAPLAQLEFALRAVRRCHALRKLPLGVFVHCDEGTHARQSGEALRHLSKEVREVLVLRPGLLEHHAVLQRRGHRIYELHAESRPGKPGRPDRTTPLMRWFLPKLESLSQLSRPKSRLTLSPVDVRTERLPMLLPHRAKSELLLTYPDQKAVDKIEVAMNSELGRGGPRWKLREKADRPPMRRQDRDDGPAAGLAQVATRWDIPLAFESSSWPSIAGCVDASTSSVCGLGPVARDLGTPDEAVQRLSLIQRTLLLALYLLERASARPS